MALRVYSCCFFAFALASHPYLLAEDDPSLPAREQETSRVRQHQLAENVDWLAVGGDRGCMRFSPLDRINRANVADLQLAWQFNTGEADEGRARIMECTPLVIDGIMYITSGKRKVFALDAASGQVEWSFDPAEHVPKNYPLASGGVNRGVAYWSDGQPGGKRRILHGSSDGWLFSLDAHTGKLDPAFGTGGVKDLREDLDMDLSRMPYGPTSAPAIYNDLVIVGFSCGEGPGPAAPGDIRAFDVRTGQAAWRFHTVPRPGEFGNDTWEGDSWKNRGAANAWGGFSVDTARGLVFAGLGSAAFDFYGGDRPGQNLFANCTIALDAKTGQRVWHFQTLHHDLWDHDLPIYPNLVTVKHDGKQIDAVAQVTKTGFVYLFERESGRPLFDIQERPVPPSTVPGEQAWPTQPVPVKPPPFAMQKFTQDDVTNIAPENRQFVLEQLEGLRSGVSFNPPSLEGTVVTPGFHGGATWSGASYDPHQGLLFVNSNNVPNVVTLVEQPEGSRYRYRITGYHKFLDQEGYPAIKPPWGQLSAIDLNAGEIRWQVTLGEHPELTARGVPPTGTENFGGTIATAGGLVFIGGTRDEMFRAFDSSTGELLWESKLPAGGYATPATYAVNGRQYVAIPASGGGKLATPTDDAIMVYALPETAGPADTSLKPRTQASEQVTNPSVDQANLGQSQSESAKRPQAEGNTVNPTYDVVVYGATSAGVMAAVEAKRLGKRVILVGPDQHLGGMTASGLGWTDTGNKAVIGGLAREFYHRVWKAYQSPEAWPWQAKEDYGNRGQGTPAIDGQQRTMWIFEPHVAERVFEDLIREHDIPVHRDRWLDRQTGVRVKEKQIESITMLSGETYTGRMFIDATYEGDLMAAAGVSYHVGRESNKTYDETWNGVQVGTLHHGHWFKSDISPYRIPGDPQSGVLPRISTAPPGEKGEGDHRIQAYCYRMCLTKHEPNRIPFAKPEGYDADQYELLLRVLDSGWREVFHKFDPIPNLKTDTNNHGPFSTDNIGMNYDYPEGSYQRRQEILAEHRRYQQGWLYFLANDPRVPDDVRTRFAKWGLAADEFVDNDHWPHQIYVREARRMIGEYVMTEHDCLDRKETPKPIGMGSYTLDSHNVQRYIKPDGFVQNEGDIGVGVPRPYEISYDSLVPKQGECQNLLVPVCVSSSHIAFGSIRMEPVFMILGHSAAAAACMAIDLKVSVQDVPYETLRSQLIVEGQVISLREASRVMTQDISGTVVDDTAATLRGNWRGSSANRPFIALGYLHDGNESNGQSSATFATKLNPGEYEVRLAFPVNSNRSTRTPVSVHHADGCHKMLVDQRNSQLIDGQWYSLGTFRFNDSGRVVIGNQDTDGYVVIDAVQWQP